MKHKAVTKIIVPFKIKNNFVEYITFNVLSQYQDIWPEVCFNKITRTPDLINQGVSL